MAASVNAPRTCPKISDSHNDSAIAAQFTSTKRRFMIRSRVMNQPRDQFFPGSGFTRYEHGLIEAREAVGLSDNIAHRRACIENTAVAGVALSRLVATQALNRVFDFFYMFAVFVESMLGVPQQTHHTGEAARNKDKIVFRPGLIFFASDARFLQAAQQLLERRGDRGAKEEREDDEHERDGQYDRPGVIARQVMNEMAISLVVVADFVRRICIASWNDGAPLLEGHEHTIIQLSVAAVSCRRNSLRLQIIQILFAGVQKPGVAVRLQSGDVLNRARIQISGGVRRSGDRLAR